MMTTAWRGPVNQLLYSLSFSRDISEEHISFCADSAVHYTTLGLGPEVYYKAICDALASSEDLADTSLPQFSHAQVVEFLRALADRLDALRPWPEPRVRPLSSAKWAEFGHAVPIARLQASVLDVTNSLQKGFRPAGDSAPGLDVLMLKLQTGETVALLGRYDWEGEVTLLTDSVADPATVIEHFIALTGFPTDKTVRI